MRASILLGLALVFTARVADATAVGCEAFESDGVIVNHCTNHGYGLGTEEVALPGTVAGLAEVRRRLVASGRLQDVPVLIDVPFFTDMPTGGGFEPECVVWPGESEEPERHLGQCYRINADTTDYGALRKLVADVAGVPVGKALRSVVMRLDAIVAPDGGRSIIPVWRDGRVSFELRDDRERLLGRLPSIDELAFMPIWAPDSRRIAFASLRTVVIASAAKGTPVRLPLTAGDEGIGKVALGFDDEGQQLVISQVSSTWGEGRTVVVDLHSHNDVSECIGCDLLFGLPKDAASRIAAEAAALAQLGELPTAESADKLE